jgi:hypothetical protein
VSSNIIISSGLRRNNRIGLEVISYMLNGLF